MILAWLGIALLAGSWLWGLSYYHQLAGADRAVWWVLVGGGAALSAGVLRRLPGRAAVSRNISRSASPRVQ